MRPIDADVLQTDLQEHCKAVCIYTKQERKLDICDSCLLGDAKDYVDRMPTIDAEPIRHGYWIFNPKDAIEMMFTLPKCSQCGAESSDGGNYCSNCGAKMDEISK